MKLDKDKLQKALLKAGCSTRNAEVFSRHLMSEDVFEDEKKKKKIKEISEVVKDNDTISEPKFTKDTLEFTT